MQTYKLLTGAEMPLMGLGTWKAPDDEVYSAIREAINIGYRHFDCSPIYGNEAAIGKAFTDAFKANDVKREEIWVTSKVWNTHHHPNDVEEAIAKTLTDLQLEYLDLYLIHWPIAQQKIAPTDGGSKYIPIKEMPLIDTWNAVRKVRDNGLAKNIGVANFSIKELDNIIDKSGETPAVNQIELHPYLQHNKMKAYCDEKGICITAYCPLGNGDKRNTPGFENKPQLFGDEVLLNIAKNNDATPAQVMLKWALQRNINIIPKSTNVSRLKENFNAQRIGLTESEMEEISAIEKGYRTIDGHGWCKGDSPYTVEYLWGEY